MATDAWNMQSLLEVKKIRYENGVQKGVVAIIHHIRENHGVCHRLKWVVCKNRFLAPNNLMFIIKWKNKVFTYFLSVTIHHSLWQIDFNSNSSRIHGILHYKVLFLFVWMENPKGQTPQDFFLDIGTLMKSFSSDTTTNLNPQNACR